MDNVDGKRAFSLLKTGGGYAGKTHHQPQVKITMSVKRKVCTDSEMTLVFHFSFFGILVFCIRVFFQEKQQIEYVTRNQNSPNLTCFRFGLFFGAINWRRRDFGEMLIFT